MAEVAAAACADFFHPDHSIAGVANAFDVRLIVGFEETGPTGARVKLRVGAEQWQAAEAAAVSAVLFVIEEDTAEGSFGPVLQKNAPLIRVKTGADVTPLGISRRGQVKCSHVISFAVISGQKSTAKC
jgi:hypothetical protein